MTVVARPRGEGILGLPNAVFGVGDPCPCSFMSRARAPSNRGQDARDTQGRDALATGLRDSICPALIARTVMQPLRMLRGCQFPIPGHARTGGTEFLQEFWLLGNIRNLRSVYIIELRPQPVGRNDRLGTAR